MMSLCWYLWHLSVGSSASWMMVKSRKKNHKVLYNILSNKNRENINYKGR